MIDQRMQAQLDTPVERDAMRDVVGIARGGDPDIRPAAPPAQTPQVSCLMPAPKELARRTAARLVYTSSGAA